mgnify:CR=1 FL=1
MYVMDDEMGGMPQQQQKMPKQEQPQGNPQGQQMQPDESNPMDEDPEIAKILDNSRKTALDGLRKLADHPEMSQYELLKKIFMLIDKSVEDKKNQMLGKA